MGGQAAGFFFDVRFSPYSAPTMHTKHSTTRVLRGIHTMHTSRSLYAIVEYVVWILARVCILVCILGVHTYSSSTKYELLQ